MGTGGLRTERLACSALCAALTLFASSRASAQEAPPRPAEDVEFEPDEPSIALLARIGEVPVERMVRYGYGWYHERGLAPRYTSVCEGPCTARFEQGQYHLALAKRGRAAVEAGTIAISTPSVIRAHYEDHGTGRALGVLLGVAGTIAGAIMFAASVHSETICAPGAECYSHETVNGGLMAGGIGVVVGSVVLGSILATRHDEAILAITPLTLPAPLPSHPAPEASLVGSSSPQGASLTFRF